MTNDDDDEWLLGKRVLGLSFKIKVKRNPAFIKKRNDQLLKHKKTMESIIEELRCLKDELQPLDFT